MKNDKLADMIVKYEDGTLPVDITLDLFAEIIKQDKAEKLKGLYPSIAKSLIQEGYISKQGKILKRF
jgi:hypothetical protein